MNRKKIWNTDEVPFNSLSELEEAFEKNEIIISVATDISRQWVMSGRYVPSIPKLIVNVLSYLMFGFFAFLLIYPFFLHKYLYPLLILPALLFFFVMHPTFRKTNKACSNIFIYLGFGTLLYYLFWNNQVLFLLVALTAIVPWFIWWIITRLSVETSIKAVLHHEDLFMDFVNADALFLSLPDKPINIEKLNEVKNPICPDCKKEVAVSAKFCRHCGAKLKEE